jgi:hypothetical protein
MATPGTGRSRAAGDRSVSTSTVHPLHVVASARASRGSHLHGSAFRASQRDPSLTSEEETKHHDVPKARSRPHHRARVVSKARHPLDEGTRPRSRRATKRELHCELADHNAGSSRLRGRRPAGSVGRDFKSRLTLTARLGLWTHRTRGVSSIRFTRHPSRGAHRASARGVISGV